LLVKFKKERIKMNKKLSTLLAAGSLAIGVQQAQAIPAQLSLDIPGGGVELTVTDNLAGDLDPAVGSILFSGSLGAYTVNVAAGASDPATVAPYPHLDLLSLVISTGAGSISIGFTDSNLTDDVTGLNSHVGGTISGGIASTTFRTYVDDGNVPFGTATLVSSLPFVGSGGFSGSSGATGVSLTAPYSVTLFADIVATGPGQTSFDFEVLTVPDGGATAMLLGMGFLGLGALARRKP
jgi:hypothetical protein